MTTDLFRSERLRLTALNPETDAALMNKWRRDTEYARLLDSDPVRLFNKAENKKWIEKMQKAEGFDGIEFMICPLDKDEPIGFVGLDGISWHNGVSWVGIGIGEREYWNKGYGSEAMRMIARYAFEELGLHRLSLNVFSYNERAIRSYEKVGFKIEGNVPEALHRDGKRWDVVFMGLLREDFRH
ncbi:MAG: GNAT family N-acetyltransferase [Anaerolineae bacterium]|jgi:RimJ/RimL family protein N-acetyltransferase|nr:GNAT family N-acetyltransferase [Anaerolineae bacterium]MBT7192304.1 GNAT family N-acetyltransferase [Anaerolineae bacterium]MBT7783313.1 GNAT family N-acetyltransferase [Anaerolineae bacterium]